jgi:hypothetical protein
VIRALVVEDENLVRSGLRMIPEAQAGIEPADVASRSYPLERPVVGMAHRNAEPLEDPASWHPTVAKVCRNTCASTRTLTLGRSPDPAWSRSSIVSMPDASYAVPRELTSSSGCPGPAGPSTGPA